MRSGLQSRLAGGVVLLLVVLVGGWTGAVHSPLADALARGDKTAALELLEEGVDVNEAQPDGMTALHWAALQGDPDLTDVLITRGANLDAVTRIGAYTPLHVASEAGAHRTVRRLLESGANAELATSTGAVPLHLAALAGDAETIRVLVAHGAPVDPRDGTWGQTPLMVASALGHVDAIQALVAAGADLSTRARVMDLQARDREDRQARERRDAVLAEFREQHDPALGEWRPTPEQVQAAVKAAREVEEAAVEGLPRDAEEWVANRSDEAEDWPAGFTALVGTQGGMSALLLAIRDGHRAAVDALLDAGADIDQPNAGDGTTPMLLAALNGHYDLVLHLVDRGADPTLASAAGATPLYAVLNKEWAPNSRFPQPTYHQQQEATYLEVMEALLAAGVDPNVRLKRQLWYTTYNSDYLGVDRTGATPFWRAAYATDVAAMRLLLDHGADPTIPTMRPPERRRGGYGGAEVDADPSGLPPIPQGGPGVYPIHAAAGVGYGQNFAANDHRHVSGGWIRAMRMLVEELGADVNQRDHNGYTPLHHAASRGDNEMIHYLVEKGADVTAVARTGQTTADMANGPVQRVPPFVSTIRLLESLGSANNNNCLSC
ncbi:MAG: hypothetical protein EA421_07155 [Gemmatimonadales bacterium]|nr:MAG: hypothetical protein EA421_07155 [Gemmatimonadales bacterium]